MSGLGLPTGYGSGLGQPSSMGGGLGLPGQAAFGSAGQNYTMWGKISGWGISALESFPEMFGIEPSQETQAFRARNPVSGFTSQLAALAIPYAAGARAIEAIPMLAKLPAAAEAFGGGNAFARGALKYGTETAMLESARLAISTTPLPSMIFGKDRTESLSDMAGGAALNVVGGGVLGGAGGAILARLAKGPRVFDIVPQAHPSFPLVTRIRALDTVINEGKVGDVVLDPDTLGMLSFQREQLKRANFMDIDPGYTPTGHVQLETALGAVNNTQVGKIVWPLVGDTPPKSGRSVTDALNELMKAGVRRPGKVADSKLLIVDPNRGFTSMPELQTALGRIGKTHEEQALIGQNQRVIRVNTGQNPTGALNVAKKIDSLFVGKRGKGVFNRVANDWFIAREEDSGLFIAAKKIAGDLKKPGAGDEWFIMKTDRPDLLDPQAAAFRDLTINKSNYWPERTVSNIGEDTFDIANTFEREYGSALDLPKTTGKATLSALNSAMRGGTELIGAYGAPTSAVATLNPRANYVVNLLKTLTDIEEQRVGQFMDGEIVPKKNVSIARQSVTLDPPQTGGVRQLIKGLTETDRQDFKNMLEMEVPFETVAKLHSTGHVSEGAFNLLRVLEQQDQGFLGRIAKLKEHVGDSAAMALVENFNSRLGHFGQTRTRNGSMFSLIHDAQTGELAGMVAGDTAQEARERAVGLIREQAKRGRDLQLGGMLDAATTDEQALLRLKAAVVKPGFLKARGDFLGYDLQLKTNPTANDIAEMVESNLKRRERYITNVVLQEKTAEAMRRLGRESPNIYEAVNKRLDALMGKQGPIDMAVNRAVDKVLSPILGQNSASKIVRVTQKTLTAFQFGFGNLAAPVLNATAMFQVTFPEAAFLLRTAGRDLSNYVTVPLNDSGGRTVGSVNMLSDIKLFWNSFKLIGMNEREAPQDFKDLVREMIAQRLISPRFAEEQFGSTGAILKDLKGAFSGPGEFARWAEAANDVLMSKSEEFNRTMGVAVAYNLSKILGIADPFRMARFTREFMSKTAFNYSTIDRPTIFTSPVGSLLGTFKTWMFHYMANMAKYAGGGRETLAPLLWQTAATAAIGGGVATPLVMPMANAASQWLTDKSFMQNVYEGTGLAPGDHVVQDTLLYGLPGMFGLSLAAQASSPGADPARDASMMFSFAAYDRMKAFGKAAGGAVEAWKATGVSPWADDQVRDQLIRALAPRTIFRAMSLTQDNAIRSLSTGYRTMDHVSIGSGALYAAGFNPVELDKTYVAYNAIRQNQHDRQALTSELGDQLAQAWADGDDVMATRVFTRAMAIGVDTSSVLRSARARTERGEVTALDYVMGQKKGAAGSGWEFMQDGQ